MQLLSDSRTTPRRHHSQLDSARHSGKPSTVHSRAPSSTGRSATNISVQESNMEPIPSEKQRRERLHHSSYYLLKESLRDAAKEDSMCQIGSFLLEDSSKIYTFGRERRFRPLVGHNGKYYLGADVEAQQGAVRGTPGRRSQSVSNTTPGPGAYTPRYGKLSKPSILTYLR
ncbi:hypothetical protein AGDE_02879 [Angomonas deanei]|nr:hypothetical protein AGDE_04784 [Angomonas deanei]EPY41046.1 hypothetical protein AGDE_02879 [Angomonas deanei]|eukprot:EPY39145.1 hypothetical protein AGDE_04784 [Angomonas deanei]